MKTRTTAAAAVNALTLGLSSTPVSRAKVQVAGDPTQRSAGSTRPSASAGCVGRKLADCGPRRKPMSLVSSRLRHLCAPPSKAMLSCRGQAAHLAVVRGCSGASPSPAEQGLDQLAGVDARWSGSRSRCGCCPPPPPSLRMPSSCETRRASPAVMRADLADLEAGRGWSRRHARRRGRRARSAIAAGAATTAPRRPRITQPAHERVLALRATKNRPEYLCREDVGILRKHPSTGVGLDLVVHCQRIFVPLGLLSQLRLLPSFKEGVTLGRGKCSGPAGSIGPDSDSGGTEVQRGGERRRLRRNRQAHRTGHVAAHREALRKFFCSSSDHVLQTSAAS